MKYKELKIAENQKVEIEYSKIKNDDFLVKSTVFNVGHGKINDTEILHSIANDSSNEEYHLKTEEEAIKKCEEIYRKWQDIPSCSGGYSNEGTADLIVYIPNNRKDIDDIIANFILDVKGQMAYKGYLKIKEDDYGNDKQYWKELLKKIPYKEVSTNHFAVNLWIPGYLNNEVEISKYFLNIDKVIKSINENKKGWGRVICPNCGEEKFEYSAQNDRADGLCRNNCGFRIHTYI
jgi:hypothetical protein